MAFQRRYSNYIQNGLTPSNSKLYRKLYQMLYSRCIIPLKEKDDAQSFSSNLYYKLTDS